MCLPSNLCTLERLGLCEKLEKMCLESRGPGLVMDLGFQPRDTGFSSVALIRGHVGPPSVLGLRAGLSAMGVTRLMRCGCTRGRREVEGGRAGGGARRLSRTRGSGRHDHGGANGARGPESWAGSRAGSEFLCLLVWEEERFTGSRRKAGKRYCSLAHRGPF